MFLQCGTRRLALEHPAVMGVVNVTPDSFSDGGEFADTDAAVRHALQLIEEGAAIIDVGGESTRPGAAAVSIDAELGRVIPVLAQLRSRTDVVLSVDTSKPEVMRAAAAAGADLINDVRGLREAGALEAAAETGAAVCLMHMQGDPRTMQSHPRYDDVVTEVHDFLSDRAQACVAAGVARERIAIDPGFGFGKTLEHNLALLRGLPRLTSLSFPVLVGLSRKSMLQAITGRPVGSRLAGSLALATLAVANGASIVRAHDVSATVDALRVVSAYHA
jgi:dihydropteroate synthase